MNKEIDDSILGLQKAIYMSSNYTRRRLHQTRLKWVNQKIENYHGSLPISRAIEYGPGSGVYLPSLCSAFSEVVAADIEAEYLSGIGGIESKHSNLKICVDDIQSSAIPDDSFGMALCSEVLEHVPNPETGLKTLHRILAPGGVAVVTTPQRYSIMELACKIAFLPWVIQVVRMIYKEPILETGHISLRTGKEFNALILQSGFEIIESTKFGLYVPLLAEFGGHAGGRLIENMEYRLHGSSLDWMLWTQAYVLRKK